MLKKTIVDITVSPKSSKNKIIVDNKTIKIYLTTAPTDGKANAELIKFFSKLIHIPQSNIKIVHGEKGRKKRLSIDGCSEEELYNILTSISSGK